MATKSSPTNFIIMAKKDDKKKKKFNLPKNKERNYKPIDDTMNTSIDLDSAEFKAAQKMFKAGDNVVPELKLGESITLPSGIKLSGAELSPAESAASQSALESKGLVNKGGSISFTGVPPKPRSEANASQPLASSQARQPQVPSSVDNRQRFGAPGTQPPIQGPLQTIQKGEGFNDTGREAARQIRERNNPNTQFVDRPPANTNPADIQGAADRQNAANASVREQVFGQKSLMATESSPTPQQAAQASQLEQGQQLQNQVIEMLGQKTGQSTPAPQPTPQTAPMSPQAATTPTPSPQPTPSAQPPTAQRFRAPEVPVMRNGSVSMAPMSRRGSVIDLAADVAAELVVPHLHDFIWDNAAKPLIESIKGEQVPSGSSMRRLQKEDAEYREQMKNRDLINATQATAAKNELNRPIQPGEAPEAPVLPPPTPEPKQRRIASETKNKPVSVKEQRKIDRVAANPRPSDEEPTPAPKLDKNATYKRMLKALGDNPTQEEMDRVRDYGLSEHRKNFPQLAKL